MTDEQIKGLFYAVSVGGVSLDSFKAAIDAIEQASRDAQADQQQISLSELQFIKRDTDSRISMTFKTPDAADQFILSLVDADVARELRRLENASAPKGDAK